MRPSYPILTLTSMFLLVACGGADEPDSASFNSTGEATGGSAGEGPGGGESVGATGGSGGNSAVTGGSGGSSGQGGSAGTGGSAETGGSGGATGPCDGTCEADHPSTRFNPCTCDPADPCDWRDDGVCQSECRDWGVVSHMFDDTSDCQNCSLTDANEPNEDVPSATEVGGDGIITDCEGWKSAEGVIETPDDEDWFGYEGDDAACGMDHISPHVELADGISGLEVCVFAKPHEPGGDPTCAQGTQASHAGGYYGCCASDAARLELPAQFGVKDNASVRMRVRSKGTAACLSYSITFGYGWL